LFRQIGTFGVFFPGSSKQDRAMVKRIGFIGFDKVVALDISAPFEVFAFANAMAANKAYDPVIVSASGKAFYSAANLGMHAHHSFRTAPSFDTIIVPGGAGLRVPEIGNPVVEFLRNRARSTRRIASVCTGVHALAQARLLDGRRVTTHWRFASDLAKAFPRIKVDADAIHLRDGKFYTSAGVTAGIDLSLALVEEDLGALVALQVAREMVVYFKRPGNQAQYSEPLMFQVRSGDRFSQLADWILRNLDKKLTVETLASRVHLGRRHFSRSFKEKFDLPPAEYVEQLRLDEARRRLPNGRLHIDSVAKAVGYASSDAFRRAFERRFGISPKAYLKQFEATNGA
jgi:transcriptional regulator GlxA family with amidase domain